MREQILQIADADWVAAVDQHGAERPNGHVAELGGLDLADWPKGSRVSFAGSARTPARS